MRSTNAIRRWCLAAGVSVLALCPPLGAVEEDPIRAPVLQRIEVLREASYAFDFGVQRGPATPALVQLPIPKDSRILTDISHVYYLFGINKVTYRSDEPVRWSATDGAIFTTYSFPLIHQRTGPMILRYAKNLLVVRPDDGRGAIDLTKAEERHRSISGSLPPNYVGLTPMWAALMRIGGWRIGDEPLCDGLRKSTGAIPTIHYDIRPLDDERIELYMTVNGKLSRWLFDGEKWTLRENYTVNIDAPFLIFNGGKGIVTKRENIWCLVGDLSEKQAKVQRIVKSSPDEPFTLVEDKVTGIDYFEYGGVLYDENGVDVCPIPRDADAATRLKAITEFVRSQRQK